jgi:hypothetical protein
VRLAAFGKDYLDDIITRDEALTKARENIEWDSDAADMVKFIESTP